MSEEQEHSEIADKRASRLPKSWRVYLFEFVLLTMAVFLGFLVDNFREELAEKQQAEELAQSYYGELLADSISLQQTLEARYRKDTALYHLKNYVLDSSLEKASMSYVRNYVLGVQTTDRFQPTDVILEQLKNSGSLRYFKSKKLQQLTGNLSTTISVIRQRNTLEIEFALIFLIPFVIASNDQEFFGRVPQNKSLPFRELSNREIIELIDSDSINISYHINNPTNFKRKDVYNMLWQYRNILAGTTYAYTNYTRLNKELLEALRKEYDIK